MAANIYETFKAILTETFGVPEAEIAPEATFEALALDSLDVVELTLVVDEEVGVKIEDEELETIVTIADAVAIVETKLKVSA